MKEKEESLILENKINTSKINKSENIKKLEDYQIRIKQFETNKNKKIKSLQAEKEHNHLSES